MAHRTCTHDPPAELLLFAGAALLMVLTPGPNMIYLISRSICQGRKAGVISLFGVVMGFRLHMFATQSACRRWRSAWQGSSGAARRSRHW